MKNKAFDFHKFLLEKGYEKEIIKDGSGGVFATIFQKEISENNWNAINIHPEGKFTASSYIGSLEYIDVEIPKDEVTAKEVLKTVQKV